MQYVLEKIVGILVLYAVWIALVRIGVIPPELVVMLIAGLGIGLAIIVLLKAGKRTIEETIRGLPQAPAGQAALAPSAMPESQQPCAEQAWSWWFARCVSFAQGGRDRAPEAFAHYQQWAAANGIEQTVPLVTFGRLITTRLTSIGGRIGQSNGRVYENISLVDQGTRAEPIAEGIV